MLYPKNLEQKLGFDIVREQLKSYCSGSTGQSFVDKIQFSTQFDTVNKLLSQTEELRRLLASGEVLPSNNFLNIQPQLRKAEIENSYLEEPELVSLRSALETANECIRFFNSKPEGELPQLKALTGGLFLDKGIIPRINLIIDENGRIRDSASSELQKVRKQLIAEQGSLRRKIESIMRQAAANSYLPDDASPTIRNGRLVLPVLAEHKRHLKGLIHDESATGQTVYIEPIEILEQNNLIREIELAERREVFKILLQLTDFIRPHVPALLKLQIFLGLVDFIRAKARFALAIEAVKPKLGKRPLIQWKRAEHPLLKQSLAKQGKKIVPQTLDLDAETHLLIVSGPNAGGKSVTLKTVGLIQYMLQCGLLVPMEDTSHAGIFEDIFIDMGDEQSIENDLSTYSSHLTNMKHFLFHAEKRSLYLIDEFGTGTEPNIGGAIAEAILQQLVEKKAFGIVNTHYGNLKNFADKYPGVKNGAMKFDVENLAPLYELEIGRPGSSFALEIATKIGLSKDVISQAKVLAGKEQVRMDELLQELELEKNKMNAQNRKFLQQNEQLEKLLGSNLSLQTMLENQRKSVLNEAKAEAKRIVQQANQAIEQTIRTIKEEKADKEATTQARKKLDEFKKETLKEEEVISVLESQLPKEQTQVATGPIKIGSLVTVRDSGLVGEVIAIKDDTAQIQAGILKSFIKISKLEMASTKQYSDATGAAMHHPAAKGINMATRMANFSPTLDMRGMRGDEAMTELNSYIDNAILLGMREIRILHGKGDGILRKLVRSQLTQFKGIASVVDEHADRGGAGISIVTFA